MGENFRAARDYYVYCATKTTDETSAAQKITVPAESLTKQNNLAWEEAKRLAWEMLAIKNQPIEYWWENDEYSTNDERRCLYDTTP